MTSLLMWALLFRSVDFLDKNKAGINLAGIPFSLVLGHSRIPDLGAAVALPPVTASRKTMPGWKRWQGTTEAFVDIDRTPRIVPCSVTMQRR